MRVDALKNRQRLLDVAIELILEVGGPPTRDAIAHRAGVGIGTLYRHFPDQQSLLQAVVRYALERTVHAGETLVSGSSNPVDALREYMHSALDAGIGVVNIIYPLLESPGWPDLKSRAEKLTTALVDSGVMHDAFRADLTERDIVFAMIRFARPLAVGMTVSDERLIAHRHLDIYLDGLCMKK